MNQLDSLIHAFNDAKDKMQREGETALVSVLRTEVFDKYPVVESVGWRQYANYFCDGDPCHFYLRDTMINGVWVPEGEYVRDYCSDESLYTDEVWKLLDKASDSLDKILYSVPKELMESIFGSEQQITVCRDGTVKNVRYTHHD